MSKTTSQKTDAAENAIISRIGNVMAQARTGTAPQMPDGEAYKRERASEVEREHRKYSPGNPTKTR